MRVVIMNRNAAVARAFALLMQEGNIEVAAEVTDAEGVVPAVANSTPDLLLVDPEFPQLDLGQLVDQVARVAPSVGVVVLAESDDPNHLRVAVGSGVRAYVTMDTEPQDVIRILHLAAEGHVFASSPAVESLSDLVEADSSEKEALSGGAVSRREIEVINLVVQGHSNKEVAEALVVSEHTVKVHLRNIYRKVQVDNRQKLTLYALQSGLVKDLVTAQE